MGACSGKSGHSSGQRRPSAKEIGLAAQLARDPKVADKPPFYAVRRTWLEEWQRYATQGGPPPGPIANAEVVSRGTSDVELSWVSAEAWELLEKEHGGGPALRRWDRELLPSAPAALPPLTLGGSSASSAPDLEKRIRRAAALHEAWYQALRGDLQVEAERLQAGPWATGARRPSKSAKPATGPTLNARKRVLQAVSQEAGGEDLRAAFRALRDAGEQEWALGSLDALVQGLCVHEEAQTVLACLLQALLDSDRLGLEMWLEQAEAMGLEAQAEGSPLLGPLGLYLLELEERERRALEAHSSSIKDAEDSADASLWRLALAALNEDDEEALVDIIAEAKKAGLDASAADLCLEELYNRRRRQRAREEPSNFGASSSPRGGPPRPDAGAPSWDNPTSWGTEEDFLEAFRRKRRQEEAAGRRRPWDDEDPPSPPRRSQQQSASGDRGGGRSSSRSGGGQPPRASSSSRASGQEGAGGFTWGADFAAGGQRGDSASDEWWRRRRRDEEDPQDPFARHSADDAAGRRGGGRRPSASGHPNPRTGPQPSWEDPGAWTSTDDFLRAWRAKQEEQEAAGEQRRREDERRRRDEQQRRQQQQARHSQAIGSTDGALAALGLPRGRVPPLAELKAAYRSMALRYHPDRPQNRGRQEEATAEFQRIKAAFDLLAPDARG